MCHEEAAGEYGNSQGGKTNGRMRKKVNGQYWLPGGYFSRRKDSGDVQLGPLRALEALVGGDEAW